MVTMQLVLIVHTIFSHHQINHSNTQNRRITTGWQN